LAEMTAEARLMSISPPTAPRRRFVPRARQGLALRPHLAEYHASAAAYHGNTVEIR
jgi:hypothetical protein